MLQYCQIWKNELIVPVPSCMNMIQYSHVARITSPDSQRSHSHLWFGITRLVYFHHSEQS